MSHNSIICNEKVGWKYSGNFCKDENELYTCSSTCKQKMEKREYSEIYSVLKRKDFIRLLKSFRSSWLEHVKTMENVNVAKDILSNDTIVVILPKSVVSWNSPGRRERNWSRNVYITEMTQEMTRNGLQHREQEDVQLGGGKDWHRELVNRIDGWGRVVK
jgi:hypothetical protein